MKHYTDGISVIGLEDSQEIPQGYTLMTDAEFEAFRNPPLTAEEQAKLLLDNFTRLTEETLQNAVDKYNKENNVLFANIHAVANYINTPTYTHYGWCVRAWDWNVQVWETARQIQIDVSLGNRDIPTDEEFLNELPKLT